MNTYADRLNQLSSAGNLRRIPADSAAASDIIDLSSNDYLGLAADPSLQAEFMADEENRRLPLTASASRLLAAAQTEFLRFEQLLEQEYGRPALLFNSGYHANTGLVSALAAGPDTLIVADRLVHASIIDGFVLSRRPFERFRHNDTEHLRRLLRAKAGQYARVLVIAESVYSMDGDSPDLEALAAVKREFPGVMLYLDEAHAVGVCGPRGLGLAKGTPSWDAFDVVVGTLGKALGSAGAYAILPQELKDFAVNTSRSLIFSTALSPLQTAWSRFLFSRMTGMEERREHLRCLCQTLAPEAGHIHPVIVGDPRRAVALSARLLERGFKVLPIRTPTVPPGTDRLRISLSAALSMADVERFKNALADELEQNR